MMNIEIPITTIFQVASAIIAPLGGILGIVGGILGIISWRRTRKIQKYQLEEIESKKKNKFEEDELFEQLITGAGRQVSSIFWEPKVGSREFKIMDRLVERGKLFRNEVGAFSLSPPTEFKL